MIVIAVVWVFPYPKMDVSVLIVITPGSNFLRPHLVRFAILMRGIRWLDFVCRVRYYAGYMVIVVFAGSRHTLPQGDLELKWSLYHARMSFHLQELGMSWPSETLGIVVDIMVCR